MKRLIWQSKGFQKTQARRSRARDFEGIASPSSEQPGATLHPRACLASGLEGKGRGGFSQLVAGCRTPELKKRSFVDPLHCGRRMWPL